MNPPNTRCNKLYNPVYVSMSKLPSQFVLKYCPDGRSGQPVGQTDGHSGGATAVGRATICLKMMCPNCKCG
jgi:hypothetical protein